MTSVKVNYPRGAAAKISLSPLMVQPDTRLARALVRWQRAAGPYWPYVSATPFLGRHRFQPPAVRSAASARSLPRAMAELASSSCLATFVDLPPTRTLPAARILNRLGLFAVPLIARWIAAPAVLRSERLLEQLVTCSLRLERPGEPRGVVFLLDGDRAGPPRLRSRTDALRDFDNRYSYSGHLFPPPVFLRQQGITAVRWIPESGISSDLRPYVGELAEAGLSNQKDTPPF